MIDTNLVQRKRLAACMGSGSRVLILHDEVYADARIDEIEVLEQAQAVSAVLQRAGYTTALASFSADSTVATARLHAAAPDVVVNLVETVERSMRGTDAAPLLLAKLGIPFTGSSAQALRNSTNKLLAKRILVDAGLPTPPFWLRDDLRCAGSMVAGRWIVKSVWEHGSVGLEESSVIDTGSAAELSDAITARLDDLGGAGYAEAYIDGREFNVALLQCEAGIKVLPIAETAFRDWPAARPRVVGWRAKWAEGSFEYGHTVRNYEFAAGDASLIGELTGLARRCWDAFRLAGYARVDFRVDSGGRPWIIDVNANPTLAPGAGYAAAVARSGRTLDEAVLAILASANCAPPASR